MNPYIYQFIRDKRLVQEISISSIEDILNNIVFAELPQVNATEWTNIINMLKYHLEASAPRSKPFNSMIP